MVSLALALHLALASTGSSAPGPTPDAAPPTAAATSDVAVADGSAPPTSPAALGTAAQAAPAAASTPPTALAVPPPAPAPRLSAITLVPHELDPGPFRAGELAGATVGAFAGDAIVIGSGYLMLQAFANGALSPTATNFRHAMYAFGIGALVVPPLTAVLVAKLTGGHGHGAFWKAMLLASAGQAAALVAGYYAAPRFWVILPVQAVALSLGASLGLHWGPSAGGDDAPDAASDAAREPPDPLPGVASALATPICTDAYTSAASLSAR